MLKALIFFFKVLQTGKKKKKEDREHSPDSFRIFHGSEAGTTWLRCARCGIMATFPIFGSPGGRQEAAGLCHVPIPVSGSGWSCHRRHRNPHQLLFRSLPSWTKFSLGARRGRFCILFFFILLPLSLFLEHLGCALLKSPFPFHPTRLSLAWGAPG